MEKRSNNTTHFKPDQNLQDLQNSSTHRKYSFTIFKIICILAIGILIAFIWNIGNAKNFLLSEINLMSTIDKDYANLTQPTTSTDPQEISLLFLGDIMLDRGIRAQISKLGSDEVFVLSTKKLSDNYDLTIANLEGPITTHPSKTIGPDGLGIPGFSFTFPTSSATALKKSGIDIVSLANNHTDNFGQEGLAQTVKWLSQSNLKHFGNPTNSPKSESPVSAISQIICEKEICIALIGYNEFTYQNETNILDEIKDAQEKNVDFIIIMPHWGVEYENFPSTKQKTLAHAWIDAGADLIVGAHPHVIQSIETYKDKKIYYSIGNYLFDQYFSYDTTHGLALGIHLEKTTAPDSTVIKSVDLLPIDNTKSITRPAGEVDSKKILDKLAEISI